MDGQHKIKKKLKHPDKWIETSSIKADDSEFLKTYELCDEHGCESFEIQNIQEYQLAIEGISEAIQKLNESAESVQKEVDESSEKASEFDVGTSEDLQEEIV